MEILDQGEIKEEIQNKMVTMRMKMKMNHTKVKVEDAVEVNDVDVEDVVVVEVEVVGAVEAEEEGVAEEVLLMLMISQHQIVHQIMNLIQLKFQQVLLYHLLLLLVLNVPQSKS